jgi:hypothetical protein
MKNNNPSTISCTICEDKLKDRNQQLMDLDVTWEHKGPFLTRLYQFLLEKREYVNTDPD